MTKPRFTYEILQDGEPEDPRRWDNVAKFAFFHKRLSLPNDSDRECDDYGSWEELETALKKHYNIVAIEPVYMYDHSGLTIATKPFSCPWDSGQIGFAFVTREEVLNEHPGRQNLTKALKQWAAAILESEVKTYDMYLRGDVWGYTIYDDGTEIESCWSFFGHDYCKQEAESICKTLEASHWKQLDWVEELA